MGELTRQAFEHVKREMGKAIVGQEHILEQAWTALLARGHCLLEGVPGTAKTLMVKALAATLGRGFARIQFTPDLMPSDVIGTNVFDVRSGTFNLRRGPIFVDFLLADEINRTPPKTQAALLECMEERQATIDGVSYSLPGFFMVFATQNPIEYEGTYPLPEAQLDRFMLKLLVDYPSQEEEIAVLERYHTGFNAADLSTIGIDPLVDSETLITRCREEVSRVTVAPSVFKYVTDIVKRSRESLSTVLGASPRASIALLLTTKAYAATMGRDYVIPDDVKRMAPAVLRHRILLRPEAEIEGLQRDTLIARILDEVEVPR